MFVNCPNSESAWPTSLLPLQWLRHYEARWLIPDLVAGVTLAAYAVPVSMAYASLAGVPPHYGIYCYLMGGSFYSLFGTSRQLAIGPTSAIAMLVGATVAGMAEGDPVRWAAIAELAALTVAGFALVAWLLRLSGLVSFISETILVGFKAGAALSIAMTQLPKLFGVKGGGSHFFDRAGTLARQLGDTNFTVLAIGLAALALLFFGERFLPNRPIALVVVVLAVVVMSTSSLAGRGVAVVGALPAGLPTLSLPSLRWRDVDGILPLAGACFLLSYIESISAARTLAVQHEYEINPRQELLALAAANAAVAFGQGFPVAGGLSQSAVNDKAVRPHTAEFAFRLRNAGRLSVVAERRAAELADRCVGLDRAGGGSRLDRHQGAEAFVADQSLGIQYGHDRACRRAAAWNSEGSAGGDGRVAINAHRRDRTSACRFSGPHPWHAALLRSGAPSGQRNASRLGDLSH